MYNIYIACSEECMKTFEDLPSIIRVLAMNLSEEEFRTYVRRNHVLEDALNAVQKVLLMLFLIGLDKLALI